ncbi:TPA: hypothetical protein MFH03_001973 [Klebsiella pneumoniae]|nr:lysis protein [Klebsiella pneumoniae]DAZ51720.1 MAG TPA: Rz lysis protein [Caudoviricetes sp.]HBT3737501.1 hypothetical protein [Klebsiella pneumoniae]HBW7831553.1 hypothetical protein [Klebsiella pneumoniae]HCT6901541.1 lysis protein [Klebsiella aerogenes]
MSNPDREGIEKAYLAESLSTEQLPILRCASAMLQFNARWPATSTISMDDGTSPRLTDASERDYVTLREIIEVA